MQRPVRLGQLWRSNLLSREEAAYMRDMAREHFEEVMAVLKALPRPMLLVLRNVNTVRAINTALGAPVDRYFLMAKRWGGAGGRGRGGGGAGGRGRGGAGKASDRVSGQRGPGLEPPGRHRAPGRLRCPPLAPRPSRLGDLQV